ncbi:alpha-N-acetylglucosaminidase-like [Patiria miniata]|uniref:Alpha-N-acetylglucosaminidase n=1 Tax=Patiria miniata TaxID=46514 RepID=A0A914ARB8_PATMI|nr:alpha-N-acetylglucosaminidase-like [Patiria miniata]
MKLTPCAIALFLTVFAVWGQAPSGADRLAAIRTKTPAPVQAQAVQDLIQRLIPARAEAFHVVVNVDIGPLNADTFQIESDGVRVNITGTTGVAAAWGFYHYLNKYCSCHVSWAGDQLDVPEQLPKVQPALKITSPNRFRYYQNVCTVSYSSVWWNWTRWEREIDWMAMNGINLPLASTAQEAIWQKVYLKMGFTQKDLDTHFAGPAFLAWARMGNIHGWGGPLTQTWHANQLQLQHQILKRMRDLGMTPVLPAFAGHVPKSIKSVFPHALVTPQPAWSNFGMDPEYCCDYLLDPTDALFTTIGKAFVEALIEEFNGTDHMYSGDTFNEMTPKQGDIEYLASASEAVYNGIAAADPNGIWLMQGWLFLDAFWTPYRVRAYIQGVPQWTMIVLDLASAERPQYSRFHSFYGQYFIWCMLGNFGGNHGLYGKLDAVNEGLTAAYDFVNTTIVGTGLTMEGINQNDVMYAFMNDLTWRSQKVASIPQWISNYTLARYGPSRSSKEVLQAWEILQETVYNCKDNHGNGNHGPIVRLPQPSGIKPNIWYDWTQVAKAWNLMNEATKATPTSRTAVCSANYRGTFPIGLDSRNQFLYLCRYDLIDVSRQVLQDLSYHMYLNVSAAYGRRSLEDVSNNLVNLMTLMLRLDNLLSTDSRWLLGNWLEAAKAIGTTPEEKKWLEYNARNQITLWGPKGEIRDYANKHWAGLVGRFYLERWSLFTTMIEQAIMDHQPLNETHFRETCFQGIESPWTHSNDKFPTTPKGDTVSFSIELYQNYRPYFAPGEGDGKKAGSKELLSHSSEMYK